LDAPDVPNAYGKTNSRAGGNNREGNKKTNHRDLPPVLSVAPEVEAPAALDQHAIKDEKGPQAGSIVLSLTSAARRSWLLLALAAAP